MQSHDKEGGEDDIGEEGDEVDHFPIRLLMIKIHYTHHINIHNHHFHFPIRLAMIVSPLFHQTVSQIPLRHSDHHDHYHQKDYNPTCIPLTRVIATRAQDKARQPMI